VTAPSNLEDVLIKTSQREYTTKSETSSPTVLLKAMMLSCAIDAKEGIYVVVTDITGAFLHEDTNRRYICYWKVP